MSGGFHIPSYLIERQVSGLQLVHWVRNVWGPRDPDRDPTAAVVKLAAWLLADIDHVTDRIKAVEARSINVADVLGDRAVLSADDGHIIHQVTGGAISLHDWTRPYSAAVRAPHGSAAADGDDGVPTALPAPSSPLFPAQGLLGQTPPGRLFQCVAGVGPDGESCYVLIGLGQTTALDRASATGAAWALADALGLDLIEREP